MLKGFAEVYEKKLQWCKDSPEVPQFVHDVLSHYEVRSHCLAVCRDLSDNAKEKHMELLRDMVRLSQNSSLTDDERHAYFNCAEKIHTLLELYNA